MESSEPSYSIKHLPHRQPVRLRAYDRGMTGQATPFVAASRNGAFDVARLLFVLAVLYAHSSEIAEGDAHLEIFTRLHIPLTWGSVGVDGFFLLSGFLIVQSWFREPLWRPFLRKRVLRIVPGYLVAVALSVLVVGSFAADAPHFSFKPYRIGSSGLACCCCIRLQPRPCSKV